MQQYSEKYLGMFFNLYLPFNIAIAAVSPIKDHDSAACFGTIQTHMNHDHPAGEIRVSQLFSLYGSD